MWGAVSVGAGLLLISHYRTPLIMRRKRFSAACRPTHLFRRGHFSSTFRSRDLRFESLEDRRMLAVFTVSNLDDVGVGSLRHAITQANSTGTADTIEFGEAVFGTIHIGSQLPTITEPLTIVGPGAHLLTIDAGNGADGIFGTGDGWRIFNIDDGDDENFIDVEISGVTLTGGDVDGNGGAIRNLENLIIVDSFITGNATGKGADGATGSYYGEHGQQGGHGGGIYTRFGHLILTSSTLSANATGGGGAGGNGEFDGGGGGQGGHGGAIYLRDGNLTLTSSTLSANATGGGGAGGDGLSFGGGGGRGGHGGAIYLRDGHLTLTGSTLTGNSTGNAGNGGEGLSESSGEGGLGGRGGSGGAIFSHAGEVNIAHSTISGNAAGNGRGGGYGYGDGSFSMGGEGGNGGGIYMREGSLTLSATHLSHNSAGEGGSEVPYGGRGGNGGAIDIRFSELTITGSTLSGNSSGPGGGASATGVGGDGGAGGAINLQGTSLTLTTSTISNNSAGDGGNLSGAGGRGGGISSSASGMPVTLLVTRSTVSGNNAGRGGDDPGDSIHFNVGGNGGDGGGIFSTGVNLTIASSTISSNQAGDGGDGGDEGGYGGRGGGIFHPSGEWKLSSSTVTGNAAGRAGEGAYSSPDGTGGGIWGIADSSNLFEMGMSIIADNTATASPDFHFQGDINAFLSLGYNLVGTGNTTSVFVEDGDLVETDPQLGPLAFNGGPTFTHALLPGSPAIDAGDPAVLFDPAEFDQRGAPFVRVAGGRIDIGAVEAQSPNLDLIVDTISDVVDGDYSPGQLSLREAVLLANAFSELDTITFDPIVFGTQRTIHIGSQLPTISDHLTITGPGAHLLTIDAGNGADGLFGTGDGWRIFNIDDGDNQHLIDVSISGLKLTGGDVGPGEDGGAIRNLENLALSQVTITGNATGDGKDGEDAFSMGQSGGRGGGVANQFGDLTITGSTISYNQTGNGGNSEALFNLAEGGHGGGVYNFQGNLLIAESHISGNITGNGGKAPDIYFGGSVYRGAGGNGGGIYSRSGDITVSRSTISGNITGQGLGLALGKSGRSGGGIYHSEGNLVVSSTTITGNTAADGGGVLSSAYMPHNQLAIITNSTISGNTAIKGGGAFNQYYGHLIIEHTTVSFNTASYEGGGVFSYGEATRRTEVKSSIISGNVAPTSNDLHSGYDGSPFNSFVSLGYNLVGSGTATGAFTETGDLVGVAPLLGPLADNGGPTLTHALLPGSPAIDTGDPAFDPDDFDPPLLYDQRGAPFVRVFDGRIDIGAFEVQGAAPDSADFNSDGYVDGFDFLAWQRGFGLTGATKSDGDANGDGHVDSDDLAVWEQQFGTVPAPLVALSTSEGEESTTNYQAVLDAALTVSLLGASANDSEALVDENSPANEHYHFDSAFASDTFLAPVEEETDYDFTSDKDDATTHEWLAEELLEAVFG